MKHRNPLAVFIFGFITWGIYSLYWLIDTKAEMKGLGAEIPTAWLLIVPIANIWWMWKYSQGVERVTAGKLSGVLAFILLWLLGPIGSAIIQDSFNNNVVATAGVGAGSPVAPAPPIADPNSAPVPPTNPEPPVSTAPTDPTPPSNPISPTT